MIMVLIYAESLVKINIECLLFSFSSYVIVVEHDLSVLDWLLNFSSSMSSRFVMMLISEDYEDLNLLHHVSMHLSLACHNFLE